MGTGNIFTKLKGNILHLYFANFEYQLLEKDALDLTSP